MGNSGLLNLPTNITRLRLSTKSFGNWLEKRRKYLGLTLEQVGDRAGFKRAYISKLENRDDVPPIETLVLIAKAVETTLEEMLMALGYLKESKTHDVNSSRVLRAYQELPQHGKDIFMDVLTSLTKRLPKDSTGRGHHRSDVNVG